ncbi:MAG: F0F1 ATP synthase subunit A [Deltaproteobacteria bacterium]|nr:MAG: F0F1 ATP synthase subunit A [Deltaproteobacteria bacterium]
MYHIVGTIIVFIVLIIGTMRVRYQLRKGGDSIVPFEGHILINGIIQFIEVCMSFMEEIIGTSYKRHLSIICSFAIFIFVSNFLGLIPGVSSGTDNINTTLACGLIIFLYFNIEGFRSLGFKHAIHIMNPINIWWGWFLSPLLFPIELVSLCIRPLSLAVRLAGNMIGDHQVLFAFIEIMPFLLPLPFFVFGLLISVIQTAVFCILSCVYISLHVTEDGSH